MTGYLYNALSDRGRILFRRGLPSAHASTVVDITRHVLSHIHYPIVCNLLIYFEGATIAVV